jgi:pimeloyl-ACP methyl ester carboxylesterase
VSFVLVHGASHGAWCWERLVPCLEADARVGTVVAIDLPGRPGARDARSFEAVRIADYVQCIVDEIVSRDLRDVVLVGHSLAGLSIPHAASRVAARVRRVVHLATSCPPEGATVMQLMEHPTSPLSRGIAGDPAAMFCNDLDEETTSWLVDRLVDEPPGVMVEPVVRADPTPDLPATYILLERDATLLPVFQEEQARSAGVDEIVRFDSGHSAFAAKPRELAELLLRWA